MQIPVLFLGKLYFLQSLLHEHFSYLHQILYLNHDLSSLLDLMQDLEFCLLLPHTIAIVPCYLSTTEYAIIMPKKLSNSLANQQARQADFATLFQQSTIVPNALLQRYNLTGPRYTSYPTAPIWNEDFSAPQLSTVLGQSKTQESNTQPYSVYVHLPFCENRCLFCGCNVVITQQKQHAEKYLTYLVKK